LEQRLAQTLMVYNKGATEFEITENTDLPFLKQVPAGDRYESISALHPSAA
jgi:hypothetical protein